MRRWRIRRRLDAPALIDLTRETYPGELSRPLRKDTPEDDAQVADLDELEETDQFGAQLAAELATFRRQPTVVVSATGPGQALDLTVTGPLRISRQLVELALAELERPTWVMTGP